MRTLATFTALAALAVVAPLALAGEQAGALPTNNALIDITAMTIRVEADHALEADEATTTPHANYAETAGSATGSAGGLTRPSCPAEPASRGHCFRWVKEIDIFANPATCTWQLQRLVNECGGNPLK